MPALFTRMSIRPSSARVRSTSAVRDGRLVTSVGTTRARRPTSFSSAAVASALVGSSSPTTMSAPRRASSSAVARPIPRPAPVTMATCPLSSTVSSWCGNGAGGVRGGRGRSGAVRGTERPRLLAGGGRLQHELHLVGGGAPERPARLVVGGLYLLAELRHGGVLLLFRHAVERLRADLGGLGGGGVRALVPAADLVPVLVEELHDRNRLVAVVQERVAQVGLLVAEEHAQLGARHRVDDVGDERRVAVDVAAPVLGEHHHVLDVADAAEELPLLRGELGLLVVVLGAGPGVAHLGHVVLPGQALGKPLRVQGDPQLSHVVLSFKVFDRGAHLYTQCA